MGLRSQLLLLSLLTLALPWAGCQTIQEMEKALRAGQANAFQATARAVAARLGSDPQSIAILKSQQTPNQSTPIYANTLSAEIIIDGYDDDWRNYSYTPQSLPSASDDFHGANFQDTDFQGTVTGGIYGENLFLFIQVKDDQIQYTTTTEFAELNFDHIILHTENSPDLSPQQYLITSGAPGYITARHLGAGKVEHRIQGVWQEWQGGYQVELRLPMSWLGAKLGLTIASPEPTLQSTTTLSTQIAAALPIITQQDQLTNNIEIFANDSSRLTLISNQGWTLAKAGNIDASALSVYKPRYLMENIYRIALRSETLPTLNNPSQRGRFDSTEAVNALAGNEKVSWYQYESLRIGRGAIPIYDHSSSHNTADHAQPIAAVIIEQSTDTILALTNSAFNRLLLYSFLTVGLASFALLAYASWLSLRIRKFNAAAQRAVDDNGKIYNGFPVSKNRDELGDLSRSYSKLLQRLRSYTSYLETLASKLSHELRTPLAIVGTSLDNLEHETLSTNATMYRDRAKSGATRLSSILNAMSEASRVEQSIRASEWETIDLQSLLTELQRAYTDIYPEYSFEFHSPSTNEPIYIDGSAELLAQMLDKLVDNAVSYSKIHSPIRLSVRILSKYIVLSVENDGPLLPENSRSQLFDSLVSLREKNHSPHHHLGLGLYIARLITEFHQGHIRGFNRDDGSGVVFEVRFPRHSS